MIGLLPLVLPKRNSAQHSSSGESPAVTVTRPADGTKLAEVKLFDSKCWVGRGGGAKGPTVIELKEVAKRHLRQNPHLNVTQIQALFNKEVSTHSARFYV